MKRKALAQIPLILGLLVMAVAVPIATKLVQENQDTRNQAANPCGGLGAGCSTALGGCCSGYVCTYGFCTKPTVAPTKKPTVAPTKKPTTPTTKPCSKTGGACNSQGDCCSGNVCWNGHCYISSGPSPTPTKKPTATPTKPKATATPTLTCKVNGAYCGVDDVCCSKKCSDGKCVVNSSVTPTCNDPCDVGDTGAIRCKSNKQQRCENRCWTFMKDCPNGCDGNYCRVTPTKVPTVTPTKTPIIPTGTVPIVTTTPVPSDKCPGTQACPDSTGKVLRDCKNPDSDGTSRDTICSKAGQKDSCGGKEYCCPSAGGVWTTDMTKCPTSKCVQCSGKPNAKASGDANCDDKTNLIDYSIWREEYLSTQCGNQIMVLPTWKADFNCDGLVDLADYTVWRNNYFLKTFK